MTDDGLLLWDGPEDADELVVMAHGAGAPMDTPFMTALAEGMAKGGLRVLRFEFPYMQRRRTEGVKAGPNPAAKLLAAMTEVVQAHRGDHRLVLAGKSMGGRVASMLVEELQADGLMVFGYPFHPPGKPDKLRTDHLRELRVPTVIFQGERDPFGKPDEIAGYDLSQDIEVRFVPSGDHSFKPLKRSGLTQEGLLDDVAEQAVAFVQGLG